jgi:hypothetical protein
MSYSEAKEPKMGDAKNLTRIAMYFLGEVKPGISEIPSCPSIHVSQHHP